MDAAQFWALVEESAAAHTDPDERSEWLIERLSRLPVSQIFAFEARLAQEDARAMTWLMWGAAHRILSFCSDDGFTDFRAWAVGLGRDTFRRIVRQPDELALLPGVRRLAGRPCRDWTEVEWPGWEGLTSVADGAYERRTGDEGDLGEQSWPVTGDRRTPATFTDPRWDFDDPVEAARRLPRLTALFPETEAQRHRQFDRELAARGETPANFFFGNRD
ncbi:DUF4240 domain-containing protein [Plantactinospora soyae]|uniref:DUF4240 domain-containing protein n=1 Tax=Plantactinospora soyae TaxID=1544732 RepID=A0A927M837_9ACTN|nr:DUF4240 domain-containing protein [Plantactinospora soyae]MBE1488426.1 hypothetical protein [Plantactinospora soyae]